MRICHHNALVDIGCHALSQSHPGVLRSSRFLVRTTLTQVISTIQIFSVAILHLLVHSTTQLFYISYASICTGVAAAGGELAKEQKHQDAWEEIGV